MPAINAATVDDSRWVSRNAWIDSDGDVRLHYIDCPPPSGKDQKGVVVLLHGFPNTSYQWRHVITPISTAGYRVIAPDYRGAGESSHPRSGYDKVTMASDIHKLLQDHIGIRERVHVVGHDIGGMIAHAYAARFSESTASVIWGECPLPGTNAYGDTKRTQGVWHFTFHWETDLPEALVAGKERIYIKHFYDRLCLSPTAITVADLDHYTLMYSQAGAMRCGMDLYRGFHQDAKDNKKWLEEHGKCKVPCLSLCGDSSMLLQIAENQTSEMYEDFEVTSVANSGHWVAEESPEDFVKRVVQFADKH